MSDSPRTLLVTGATGFVGRATCARLGADGARIRAAIRDPASAARLGKLNDSALVGDINGDTSWTRALEGVDTVVHLAARVHQMNEAPDQAERLYRETNVEGTLRLGEEAARCGVRRLVFMSSMKVHGDETTGTPASERVEPDPTDAYGRSKWAAEQGLRVIGEKTGLEVVALRPPLVFGPGVAANFLRLIESVDRGVPLPLGRIRNQRSLVFVDNLASAVAACVHADAAAGRTFAVADEPPVSTPDLVRLLARALGRSPRLVPVPPVLLGAAARAAGKTAVVDRLLGSLVVDGKGIRDTLGWIPPATLEEGIRRTAAWFRTAHRHGKGE